MSVTFLPNQLGFGKLQVSFAWGADLSADEGTWTFTDVATDVMMDNGGGVSITIGRGNEASVAQPANCTFKLKNQTGAYTPGNPASANYPYVRLGTPIWVRVSLNGGINYTTRFQGEVSAWSPGWDAQGKFGYVTVTASGITRRLGQGTKPILNVLTRYHVRNGAAAVWPFDDGTDSTQAVNAVPNGAPMQLATTGAFFGRDSQISGNPGLQGTGTVASLPSPAPAGDDFVSSVSVPVSGELHLDFWRNQAAAPDASETRLVTADLSGGSASLASFEIRARMSQISPAVIPGWTVRFAGVATLDTATGVGSPGSAVDPFDGLDGGFWHNVHLKLVQSGGNVVASIYIDGSLADSHTFASTTLPTRLTTLHIRNDVPVGGGTGNFDRLGPHAINTTSLGAPSYTISSTLYAGETATDRLARLCDEEGIKFTTGPGVGPKMGAQAADTFLNLVRECESADQGSLVDGRNQGLNYVTRAGMYNQSAQVTINASSGQVPATPGPLPTLDDQRVTNRVTVTRTDGSSVVVEDTSGPLGSAAIGEFDSRYLLNLYQDSQLSDVGRWIIHLRTAAGMRYPQVLLDLVAAPELATTWLGAFPAARVDITNLSTQLTQLLADTVSLVADGWTEFLNSTTWRVVLNCSNFQPWVVDALSTNLPLEMSGQTLNSNLSAGATSLSLATAAGHDLFTTLAADFPRDLNVNGWKIHVTSASGTSSPQTLTISASPNTSTISSGTAVTLWHPPVLAL